MKEQGVLLWKCYLKSWGFSPNHQVPEARVASGSKCCAGNYEGTFSAMKMQSKYFFVPSPQFQAWRKCSSTEQPVSCSTSAKPWEFKAKKNWKRKIQDKERCGKGDSGSLRLPRPGHGLPSDGENSDYCRMRVDRGKEGRQAHGGARWGWVWWGHWRRRLLAFSDFTPEEILQSSTCHWSSTLLLERRVHTGAPLVAQWQRIHLPTRRCEFDPWVGKTPRKRKWKPSLVFLPGKSHGQRSLAGYSPWGPKELDSTEQQSMGTPGPELRGGTPALYSFFVFF